MFEQFKFAIRSTSPESHSLAYYFVTPSLPGLMSEASAVLGEFMLKGWVLTDEICTRCRVTPMLRSSSPTPRSFCAQCDKGPNASNEPRPSTVSPSSQALPPIVIPESSPSTSSSSRISGTSTPPTEVSSALSSPTFAAPVDTPELLRRRAQSDRASSEIGQRLLKGWAMLAEECPNSRCYGVPLVRPPKPGGGKDVRKVCVICDATYITEIDSSGWERLVPFQHPRTEPPTREASTADDSSISSLPTPSQARASFSSANTVFSAPTPSGPSHSQPSITSTSRNPSTPAAACAQALELALTTLSTRLTTLSNSTTSLDVAAISVTAEAIGKVASALSQVNQVQN